MPSYKAPVEDAVFVLNDVLGYERYANLEGFSEAPSDLVQAILTEAARFSEEVVQPLNQAGDREGCTRHEDGSVTTPDGFKAAYDQFSEAGWIGLSADTDYGGQGLPYTLSAIINEFMSSACMSWGMYPGLTQGAIAALNLHGTDEQKALYLPHLVSGQWSGTMNLTEPQCGTDLGLIKTRATPADDGSYHITGQKIFISAGEHDLTTNIIHLVLARIEGSPEGTKGISLFVVPKFLPDEQGEPGERNGVSCGALEKKMGIHANATCVMNYDDAVGWLVGERDKGLRAMFTMMNEARVGVGIQGLAQSELAYQNAVTYARERRQGRALDGPREPDEPADPILVHPDIRRTLLDARTFNEAARALVIWTALKSDISHRSEDEADRQAADDAMGLMTPVLKAYVTDKGFENTVAAQQVYGGHGYIAEWGMEQFVRDARIAMIYEGANGIQALDLVGRKLPRNGGRAVRAFFAEVDEFIKANQEDEALSEIVGSLKKGADDLQNATLWFMSNALAKPDNAGAGSTPYLHLFGLVALGYMWALIAKTCQTELAGGASERREFLETKLLLARYFMERAMPESGTHLAQVSAGSATMMEMPDSAF